MTFVALVASFALAGADPIGIFRYDPVLLIDAGKQEIGAFTITADHYGYRYRFASAANRAKFLAEPDKYEIQLGGGCGKMGSLSGRGSPDRFAVYKGKIYVFASDGCRTTFLANADNLIEKDAPPIAGTAVEAKQGRALIDKAVAWAGGSRALAQLNSLKFAWTEDVKSGNVDYKHTATFAIAYPDRAYQVDRWNETEYGNLIANGKGEFVDARGRTVMHPSQVRAVERLRNQLLPTMLRAHSRKDFLAFSRGAGKAGERVEIHFDGSWGALEIDPQTGAVQAFEFIARRATHDVERHEVSAFTEVGGVKVPQAWTEFFAGKERAKRGPIGVEYSTSLAGISFVISK